MFITIITGGGGGGITSVIMNIDVRFWQSLYIDCCVWRPLMCVVGCACVLQGIAACSGHQSFNIITFYSCSQIVFGVTRTTFWPNLQPIFAVESHVYVL